MKHAEVRAHRSHSHHYRPDSHVHRRTWRSSSGYRLRCRTWSGCLSSSSLPERCACETQDACHILQAGRRTEQKVFHQLSREFCRTSLKNQCEVLLTCFLQPSYYDSTVKQRSFFFFFYPECSWSHPGHSDSPSPHYRCRWGAGGWGFHSFWEVSLKNKQLKTYAGNYSGIDWSEYSLKKSITGRTCWSVNTEDIDTHCRRLHHFHPGSHRGHRSDARAPHRNLCHSGSVPQGTLWQRRHAL